MPPGFGSRLFEKHKVTPSDLVNHLFLPKRQPQSEEPNVADIEQAILEYVYEVSKEALLRHDLTKLHHTLETWADFQAGRLNVKKILGKLKDGESACFYVRKQNCTMQFTKLEENMRVITFRSSLPNDKITGTSGSLRVTYPETVDFVPISSLLQSECFSNQLDYLTLHTVEIAMPKTTKAGHHHEETREPPFPYVISEFLVKMLCPKDPDEFDRKLDFNSLKIQKKLRDQINWDQCDLPFRRSGLWISVKAFLQMNLQEEMRNKCGHGRLVYKIVILEVLASLAMDYYQMTEASWDIIAQILVKLARRSKKLSEMEQFGNDNLEIQRQDTLKLVADIIADIYAAVTKEWQVTAFPPQLSSNQNVRKITHEKTDWIKDCIHTMNMLTNHLNTERIPLSLEADLVDNLKMIDPVIQTQGVTLSSLLARFNNGLSTDNQDFHLNNHSVWIYQVEWFARHGLATTQNCKQIFGLLLAYTKTVFSLYGRTYADPMYFSRMTITVLKFVAVLDKIAVEQHPMLKMYKTGIKQEMFESLLIPEKCDMVLVEALQKYFKERNSNATHGDWLGESSCNKYSFSVKFAQSKPEMQQLKSKILADSEERIRRKEEEIKRVRHKCRDLERKIQRISHSKTWNRWFEMNVHDTCCRRCDLQSDLKTLRKSVSRYQHPLPPQEDLRDAVVFELRVPEEIVYIRDSVCILLNEILGHRVLDPEVSPDSIHTKWMQFKELTEYYQSSVQHLVQLGSENMDTLSTHYGRENPDVMDCGDSSFIFENGLNCKMFKITHLGGVIPTPFTLQIGKTAIKDAASYQALQFTLDGKRPTENQVIAKQSTCHQNVTLMEFITFGSIRSGENIQLRNLYAAIASQLLSLEKEPVVTLIMQTIWELGPGKREIHVDFEHTTPFCQEFLELLEKLCDENATNWGNPMVLLSLTLIAVKILEMTESAEIRSSTAAILQKYRAVTEQWCIKLEALISRSTDADKKEEKELVELLLKASICSAFTFNVSSAVNLPYILKDPVDVTYWLKTLSRLHHLVVRENILQNLELSDFLKNLLRHARITIPLNLQDYLNILLGKGPRWNRALHDFVCSKWQGAVNVRDIDIPTFNHSGNRDSNKKHAYQGVYKLNDINHLICVDILRGAFFVDGFPPSVLPETIVRHSLFTSFFRTSKFRVQRDSSGTFKTVDKYCGQDFEFTEAGKDLVIRQMSGLNDGNYFEILPRDLFEEQVALDLIQNFTHWYDSKTKEVYFRRPTSGDSQVNVIHDTDFILKQITTGISVDGSGIAQEWRLKKCTDNSRSVSLVSISSEGFRKITGNLRKLESKRFIHVQFLEYEDELGTIHWNIAPELWRLNMSFSLNQVEGLLYCDNYPEYYVPLLEGQSLGTLVGLQSGLVLEKRTMSEFDGRKKLFLIQHGKVKIKECGKHQAVYIDGALRNPSYFVYKVDQILHRLCPGNSKSAWLYLALLHASTSSPFPDPFTQLTGTEMTMWILQSGFVWSCSPYDLECLETLHQIASLSPKYSYYPNHLKVMQTTEWPQGLESNSYAAYDGYALIHKKLVSDSCRLDGLFQENSRKYNPKTNVQLCQRSYYRNLNMYNKVAHLTGEFIKDLNNLKEKSTLPSYQKSQELNDELTKLAQSRQQRTSAPHSQTVSSFIMTSETLPYDLEDDLTPAFLGNWFTKNLRQNWLRLYSLCSNRTLKEKHEHELTIIFGAMLYSGEGSLEQLLGLHNITVINLSTPSDIPEPVRSLTNQNFEPMNKNFVSTSVSEVLKENADSPPSLTDFETYQKYQDARTAFDSKLDSQVTKAVEVIRSYWPAGSVSDYELRRAMTGNNLLNCTTNCLKKINGLLAQWFDNLELERFVDNVDELLKDVGERTQMGDFTRLYKRKDWNVIYEIAIDLQDVWIEQQSSFQDITSPMFFASSEDAQIFFTGKLPDSLTPNSLINEQRNRSIQLAEEISGHLNDRVEENNPIKVSLKKAGVHVRLAPIVLLRDYLLNWNELPDKDAAFMIGSLAVIWANVKRLNRLIMFQENETKFSVELTRELGTGECENWNPLENPEWLLLELELDLTIRSIQVDVAKHMMDMPGDKNGVMQLNMGEGKTSVIVPMVVSTIASKKTMLCRVTVLNSIFATNQSLLSFAIGGFLNKRVYTIPCSRDVDISRYLDTMATMYQECVRLGGVVITLPEYRLSFRLQMYNKFLQNQMEVGFKIHEIESWLRKNARDIVDESDEIFSVKYQLIYTTGKQLPIDGGSMRWTVCQKILELISQVATYLFNNYGPDVIEFQPEVAKENPEKFTHFRILTDACKVEFYQLVADGILDDLLALKLTNDQRTILREFLINEHISEDNHQKLLTIEDLPPLKKEIVFLISGYLRRGILFAALKKRWRVDCGVKVSKPGTSSKLMAVPFRAKDVAAERTEFGHPDMAIVLTQLSYYYSGLNDEQLFQCFHILETAVTGPDGVYNSWIKKIPEEKIKTDTIKLYKGINLQDYEQRTKHLFPLLRKHKAVVDFWLENVAFPKECKQFPGKLVTNAWDLCYERFTHPTTGFSGTNDTSLLLPAQISQQDLAVLMETNSQMEATLGGKENEYKRTLKMAASCREVLQYIIEDDLQVLIDAGALMLELGNEKIAQLWLELDKRIEGVVYFNDSGEMVIKVRQQGYRKREKDLLLTLSSFRDRLDKCAVYLDDQHTRGTDIKLGTTSKACVTVGSGMRRDKLIQACMRMRKLGKGQSVHFYISHEVHNKINLHKRSGIELPITVEDILSWVKWNSSQFEKDGLVYWATNARNYAKNLAADDLFELSDKSIKEMEILAKRCEDPDAQKLTKMYGAYHHRVLLIKLIPRWFSTIKTKLSGDTHLLLHESVLETLKGIETQVLQKCTKHIPDKIHFHSMLEEEQEKELEPEQEEHVEKYRPPSETPLAPHLHDNVFQCVTQTGTPTIIKGICHLPDMFKDTTIWNIIQANGWGNQWYVSEDFIRVVQSKPGEKLDCYLRPMTYFLAFTKKGTGTTTCILLLSQFEVNKLIQRFRENKCAENATLHMFTGRRMDGQPIFVNNARLQLPIDLAGRGTPLDKAVMTPMLIAAGNLYFDSIEEQEAFEKFLGLALRRNGTSKEEEMVSTNKWNTAAGFVMENSPSLRGGCIFQEDPAEMVRGILKIRNEVLRDTDHVVQRLERCSFLSLENDVMLNSPPLKRRCVDSNV